MLNNIGLPLYHPILYNMLVLNDIYIFLFNIFEGKEIVLTYLKSWERIYSI